MRQMGLVGIAALSAQPRPANALTSTLTVFDTFTRGCPLPSGLDVLTPQLKDSCQRVYDRAAQNTQSV